MKRKILFLTGTRADFGKLKPLIHAVAQDEAFEYAIFVTGMHVLSRYGFTVKEVYRAGFQNVYTFMNHVRGEPMEVILGNTVLGLSRYVEELAPDMIVVHGDRVEAMAGAIVGALRNVLVAHIEGGEVSGTIDEVIRHAVTKLSHIHFVANDHAAKVVQRMGESPESVFTVGSPDIDVMLDANLPAMAGVRAHYEIDFDRYAIAILHPVTTEGETMKAQAEAFTDALIDSGRNYVVIYPNNDEGCEYIFDAYERLKGNPRFRIFPSIRFESFLALLKEADFIIGNSSAGVREAPVYAVPTVDVGSRQHNRFQGESIFNVEPGREQILAGIEEAMARRPDLKPSDFFGRGDSAERFMKAMHSERLWSMSRQKGFFGLPPFVDAVSDGG